MLCYTEFTKIYIKIRRTMQTPTEIMEVLKLLIFSSDVPKPIYDGATKTTVSDISLFLLYLLE